MKETFERLMKNRSVEIIVITLCLRYIEQLKLSIAITPVLEFIVTFLSTVEDFLTYL